MAGYPQYGGYGTGYQNWNEYGQSYGSPHRGGHHRSNSEEDRGQRARGRDNEDRGRTGVRDNVAADRGRTGTRETGDVVRTGRRSGDEVEEEDRDRTGAGSLNTKENKLKPDLKNPVLEKQANKPKSPTKVILIRLAETLECRIIEFQLDTIFFI